jgi:hypothetical protein
MDWSFWARISLIRLRLISRSRLIFAEGVFHPGVEGGQLLLLPDHVEEGFVVVLRALQEVRLQWRLDGTSDYPTHVRTVKIALHSLRPRLRQIDMAARITPIAAQTTMRVN